MPLRPCLDCGALSKGTRCEAHATEARRASERGRAPKPPHYATRYDWAWRQHSKRVRADYIETWGARGLPPLCPGWGTPPHPTTAEQLVVDHDIGPCCRSCNSRKAATHDRAQAKAQREGGR
jgi:hypothetical protein